MERLGLGPEELLKHNPRLIYARLTGFGQKGAYANMAGHDINYLAVAGVLGLLGRADAPPTPPANLLADFAGGGLLCAFGIVMCLFEREKSGKGQVIDSAMQDGALYFASQLFKLKAISIWDSSRGKNVFNAGTPFYDTYACKDGRFMSVGAIEPAFYKTFLEKMELTEQIKISDQLDSRTWDRTREIITKRFLTRSRDEWQKHFDGSDACTVPVLELHEVPNHPHNAARNVLLQSVHSEGETNLFLTHDPAPAPRLSRTPAILYPRVTPKNGEHTLAVLKECGFLDQEIQQLISQKIIFEPTTKQKKHLCKNKQI